MGIGIASLAWHFTTLAITIGIAATKIRTLRTSIVFLLAEMAMWSESPAELRN